MIEDTDFKTYLSIAPYHLGIYLFDTKKLNYIYKEELITDTKIDLTNFNVFKEFLEKNIFKIEKLIGNFLNKTFLITETKHNKKINIGLKKKNYDKKINKSFLENILTDAKDLFNENYPDQKITHLVVKKYLVDGLSYYSFQENLIGDDFSLELQINHISINFIYEIEKALEKYQIEIEDYLDKNYVENYFKDKDLELCMMAHKIQNGSNYNEVKLVPKKLNKKGFFEKFFQLFS